MFASLLPFTRSGRRTLCLRDSVWVALRPMHTARRKKAVLQEVRRQSAWIVEINHFVLSLKGFFFFLFDCLQERRVERYALIFEHFILALAFAVSTLRGSFQHRVMALKYRQKKKRVCGCAFPIYSFFFHVKYYASFSFWEVFWRYFWNSFYFSLFFNLAGWVLESIDPPLAVQDPPARLFF